MNDNILQNLLYQVNAINKKYENIAEITGENFNIFNILGLTTNEVRTHSAFIAELLNPKGSHGKKDVFLKLFIALQQEKVKSHNEFYKKLIDFKTENSLVFVEWYIGFKNENESEGGRIDILIKDKNNNAIIIENKIYAGDQPKQLVRYDNAFKDAPIFYLTLNKSKPSDDSIGELEEGKNFFCISYKNDILEWLVECRKEAVSHSLLRETITQYINLIKLLTNQTINDAMQKELTDLISNNPEFIKLTFELSNSINDIKQSLILKFKAQLEEIALELKNENIEIFIEEDLFKVYKPFGFIPKKWSECRIGFEIEEDGCFSFGVCRKDWNTSIEPRKVKQIQNVFNENYQNNENWPIYKYFEDDFQNLNNKMFWASIASGRLKEEIKGKVNDILYKLKDLDL